MYHHKHLENYRICQVNLKCTKLQREGWTRERSVAVTAETLASDGVGYCLVLVMKLLS